MGSGLTDQNEDLIPLNCFLALCWDKKVEKPSKDTSSEIEHCSN